MKIETLEATSTLTITNFAKLKNVKTTIADSSVATLADKTGGNYDVTAVKVGDTTITISAENADNKTIPVNVAYDS